MNKKRQAEKEFLAKVMESQGILHKVCRIYCDNEEHRKDLFQEILINLWKSYKSFRADSKFSTWMYRVALNVAIQDLRKVKKRKLLFFESFEFREHIEEPGYSELENERFRQMYQAISGLNKLDKAIVLLYLEGNSNEEIADLVGITTNYVRVKMTRIKEKLSKKIKEK
ncbi:RNA polymerase sigma factor [Roseivirga sp.]|uniref:RNA polymerase sigma factor n=1 Tax=Roseivirga sp. TaxID=1964215 RepID=UPI003B52ED75